MTVPAAHTFEGVRRIEITVDAASARIEPTEGGDEATTVTLTDRRGAPLVELLDVHREGETLHVQVRSVRGGRWKRNRTVDARLQVVTPHDVELSVRTDAGAVKVIGREAPVRIAAHVAAVELSSIIGDVEVRNDAGSVKLHDGIGNVVATSDAGAITVQRQQGERLELRASAGSITASRLEVGTLEAHTDAGSIRASHATPPVHVEASCSVGAVTLELPQDAYDIDQQVTGLGRAKLEGLEHVVGAERTIRVRSKGVGSVTVRAAAGAPAFA